MSPQNDHIFDENLKFVDVPKISEMRCNLIYCIIDRSEITSSPRGHSE